jgi:hypothetical protein
MDERRVPAGGADRWDSAAPGAGAYSYVFDALKQEVRPSLLGRTRQGGDAE